MKNDKARSDHRSGDNDGQVVNVSGYRWPGAEMRPRGRTMPTTPPGRPLRHRTPVEITGATTGPALGRFTEEAAANTVRHLSIEETVDAADAGPREQELLDHLFGLNLRGRDRA